jgi:polysaccharide export outer membrane protein
MKLQTILLVLVAAFGTSAVCQSQSLRDETSKTVATADLGKPTTASLHPEDYIIGPEDVLAVNVWKEPEISRNVPVRPDGKITLPLIGDVEASGSTPRKVQEEIKKRLGTFVSNPEVTVIVQEIKSLRFNIMGEVAKPGSYSLSKPTTVLDAIAMAGGLRDFAKQGGIYVLRVADNGSTVRLPFDYKQVIKAKKKDLELQSRDTVIVP